MGLSLKDAQAQGLTLRAVSTFETVCGILPVYKKSKEIRIYRASEMDPPGSENEFALLDREW
jgi:hypothetical protein